MKSKKSYPQKPGDPAPRVDNLGLWIGAASSGWDDECLEGHIFKKLEPYDNQIRRIERELTSFHTKNVKGKEYLYRVEGGSWIYVGKEDPRPGMREQKAALEAEKNKIRADMQLCVKKKIREHLVIDIELFKRHVSKKLPENMIQISEVLK